MKKLILFSLLALSSVLTACGGSDSSNKPETLFPDGFEPAPPPVAGGDGNIVNTPLPLFEDFDGAVDIGAFFSAAYKPLTTDNPDDETPSFYYPTCCLYDDEGNVQENNFWLSDTADKKMRFGNARFTIGQTLSDLAGDSSDPKINTTAAINTDSWGELDLSRPYKVSFCVVQAGGSENLLIFVDNNTTGEANSIWGGGTGGSPIFKQNVNSLIPGKRVTINVPGETKFSPEGPSVLTINNQVGEEHSFLQVRVGSGGYAVIDGLLIEYQDEASIEPAAETCVADPDLQAPPPKTAPVAPAAPTLIVGDAQLTATWSSVSGAESYEVFYSTANSAEGAIGFTGNPVAGNSAVLTGLINDTPYYVFIRAANAIGVSEFSVSQSATPTAPSGVDSNHTWGFNPLAYQAEENFFSAEFTDGGNNNIVVSDDAREVDGLLVFLSNGTALRYRGNDNRWNFNGHSWSGGSSVMVPVVGEDAPELRAYVGIPVDPGRAFTLSLDYQQSSGSGADSGKIVLIGSDNKVLAVKDALSGSDSITFEAGADHTLSHVKIAYSREGAGGGGVHINNVVKTYASAEAWTGEALALAGSADIAPSGSVSVNEETALTLTATGGNLSSSSHQIFFAHQEVTESDFMFTARIASVTGADEGAGNAYRFGIMIMSDTQVVAEYSALAAWADAGFYVTEPNTFVGSRANMKADGSRSRSDIAPLTVGDYVRIEIYDDGELKRVKRYYSTDGIEFTQANSTTDFKATSETDNWRVGFYAAPGVNDITVEFDNISIAPLVSE